MPVLDEQAYLRLIRGETGGPAALTARGALAAAAALYAVGAGVRNLAYDRGWKRVEHASIPVVSVGNITLGGTGKTPMVEWTPRRLRSRGARVAIVSRGYAGSTGLNDEGRLLEDNLPDVPHLQGADRVRSARIAVEELESQILVLDDAFQHRRLHRDLDLVLLDALDPFGLGRICPRGLLREPVSSLGRADVVLLSKADLVPRETRAAIRREAEARVGRPLAWAEIRQAPRDVVDSASNADDLAALAGVRIAAFCGIGNPTGFARTLAALGLTPVAFRAFPDHHNYTSADVDALTAWAGSERAELLLTTRKDLVKLRSPSLGATPLRALRIGVEFLDGGEVVEAKLDLLVQVIESPSDMNV